MQKKKQRKKSLPFQYKQTILEHPMLGKVPDATIAKELGCSVYIVGHHRRANGIPAGRGKHYSGGRQPIFVEAIKAHPLLGKVPDRVIAEELGCSLTTVHYVRNNNARRTSFYRYPEEILEDIPQTIRALKKTIKVLQTVQNYRHNIKGERRC